MKKYDLLVLDEIGLTQDQDRGIKADFILVRAKINATNRVIALGTPFYNWKNYVDMFGFVQIQEDKRPILLETYPIYYTKTRVNYVRKDCEAIREGVFPQLQNGAYAIDLSILTNKTNLLRQWHNKKTHTKMGIQPTFCLYLLCGRCFGKVFLAYLN